MKRFYFTFSAALFFLLSVSIAQAERVQLWDHHDSVAVANTFNALVTASPGAHAVEKGHYYTTYHFFEAVADGANATIVYHTGDTPNYGIVQVQANIESYGKLYEAPTISSNGTAIPSVNLNRYENGSKTGAYHSPTITDNGTPLTAYYIPGGTKSKTAGVKSRGSVAWLSKSNTAYLIRIQNISGAAGNIYIQLEWYLPELK